MFEVRPIAAIHRGSLTKIFFFFLSFFFFYYQGKINHKQKYRHFSVLKIISGSLCMQMSLTLTLFESNSIIWHFELNQKSKSSAVWDEHHPPISSFSNKGCSFDV